MSALWLSDLSGGSLLPNSSKGQTLCRVYHVRRLDGSPGLLNVGLLVSSLQPSLPIVAMGS